MSSQRTAAMRRTRNQGIVSYSSAAAAALVAPLVSPTGAGAAAVRRCHPGDDRPHRARFSRGIHVRDRPRGFSGSGGRVEREIVSLVLKRDVETSDYYMLGFYTNSRLRTQRLRVEVLNPEDQTIDVRFVGRALPPPARLASIAEDAH